MKIGLAQTRALIGDIDGNLARHVLFVEKAGNQYVEVLIFPELSLTGYEPELAGALALTPEDERLSIFRTLSHRYSMTIGVGLPLRVPAGICIGMAQFQPDRRIQLYTKQYLHPDEEPYFVEKQNSSPFLAGYSTIATAICYEISVPEHAENVCKAGAQVYIASVAKTAKGVAQATDRLAHIAQQYAITVLMVNGMGPCEGQECAGQSAVWDSQGTLMGQLPDCQEGLLIYDTESRRISRVEV